MDYMSKVPYASTVGSLMYAMVCTRPNIAHAVGVVSKYMNNPRKEYWMAVKWIGKKVNYSILKPFGCEAFVHIDKENRTKLEAKSKKCTFIGYGVNDFGYRLYDYENHKIIRSRDVIFNEKVLYKNQLQEKKQEKENKEYAVLDEITEKVKVPENNNNQQP